MRQDDGTEAGLSLGVEMNSGAQPSSRGQRSATRLAAVQALYQIDVAKVPAEEALREFKDKRWSKVDRELDLPDPDSQLLDNLVQGVSSQCVALDIALEAALSGGHSIDRLEVLLRAVLRAGAYELKAVSAVPSKVVINEYVDLAHAFFAGKEPALVNAVLDRIAHQFRPAEKTSDPSIANGR